MPWCTWPQKNTPLHTHYTTLNLVILDQTMWALVGFSKYLGALGPCIHGTGASVTCYHAKNGHYLSMDVGLTRGVPQNWDTLWSHPLEHAWPLTNKLFPTWVTMTTLITVGQMVRACVWRFDGKPGFLSRQGIINIMCILYSLNYITFIYLHYTVLLKTLLNICSVYFKETVLYTQLAVYTVHSSTRVGYTYGSP